MSLMIARGVFRVISKISSSSICLEISPFFWRFSPWKTTFFGENRFQESSGRTIQDDLRIRVWKCSSQTSPRKKHARCVVLNHIYDWQPWDLGTRNVEGNDFQAGSEGHCSVSCMSSTILAHRESMIWPLSTSFCTYINILSPTKWSYGRLASSILAILNSTIRHWNQVFDILW